MTILKWVTFFLHHEKCRDHEKRKNRLEGITNMQTKRSRQHYLRFSLPETYQQLIDLEIEEDYSMDMPAMWALEQALVPHLFL